MSRSRTRPIRSLGALVVVALAIVAWVVPAGADTASDLAAARQKVTEAQDAANQLAAEFSEVEGRYDALQERIDQLEASIAQAQTRIDELEIEVRDRAVRAYVARGGAAGGVEALMSTSGPMEATRRTRFLAEENKASERAVHTLANLKDDLADQRAELRRQREELDAIRAQLQVRLDEMQKVLAEANAARDALIVKLDQEKEAAAQAEAARLRAIQAASRPAPGGGGGGGGAAGQIIVNPGGGPFQCPVQGSAYVDDYGPRGGGFHYGIDMMSAVGTPLVAVKAGTFFTMSGGAGGNELYLNADDGNTYFYAHLSDYAGGPRAVVQGEVVGWVGMTGNTSGPHLHFEIRIGGPNGQKVDPYPTLRGAGC